MANKIELEISAGTDLLVKGLKDGDRAVVKFTDGVNKQFNGVKKSALDAGSSIAGAFKNSFTDLAKGVAVGNLVASAISSAANAIKNFVAGSIDAAKIQEDAINRLSQALRANGEFTNTAIRGFEAYASQLQKTSKFGDEVILNQLAIAKSFGASNEEAKKLVQAAVNLEATFGGTLEQRVQELGKTLNGTKGRLGQLIPEFQNLTTEQLRAGNAIDIVNSKFAGAGQAAVRTYSGATTQLKNAFGDLQEELGFFVTKNPAVISAVQTLTRGFEAFTAGVKSARQALGIGLDNIDQQKKGIKDLGKEFNKLGDEIEARRKTLAEGKFFNNVESEKVQLAKIAEFEARRNEILKQRQQLGGALREDQELEKIIAAKQKELNLSNEELAKRAELNNALKQQRLEFSSFLEQQNIQDEFLATEIRSQAFENQLQFELEKIEVIRQSEIEKANLIQESGARLLAIQQANEKAQLASQKATINKNINQDRFLTQQQEREFQQRVQTTQNYISAGLALAKQGSIAQKALSIAQATVSTYTAATQALASPPGPPKTIPLAASVVALGLANVARIAGAKFANGGIVGGNSFSGDRVPARVNSGEMILNKSQQRRLFDIANGGESGGGSANLIQEIRSLAQSIKQAPIVVQANGREIARLVRDEGRNGFEVMA